MIPDFKTYIGESVWTDIQKRSSGDDIRKEDDVNHMDFDTFADYIEDNYSEKGNWFAIRENEDEKSRHIEIDIIYRKEIDLTFNVVKGEIYNILVQGNKNYVDIPGLKQIFNVNIIGSSTFSVYEKDWSKSNNTFVKLIEFYLNKKTNESVWTDMQKRSSGEDVRKEDDVNNLDAEGLYDYIKSKYEKYVFYLDKTWYNEIYVDVLTNISLILKPNENGGLLHVLLSWSKEKISMPFFDKLSERFKVENPSVNRRIIKEKDGTITNQTFIDVIDFFLYNIDNMLVKESVWTDMQKRSSGEDVRKEDDIDNMDMSEFCNYLYFNYWPTEWNDGEVIDQFPANGNIWRIQIPIEAYKQNGTTKKLVPPITMEFNKSTGKLESILLSSHLLKNYPELRNIYQFEFDELKVAHIVPKKGKLTNSVCVNVIDGVLNIVKKPLFYKKTHK